MRYYRVKNGYGPEEYVSITEDELHLAYYLFTNPSERTVFRCGPVRGQDIITILPDIAKSIGWNSGYKMQPEDYREYDAKYKDHEKLSVFARKVAAELPKQFMGYKLSLISERAKEVGGLKQLTESNIKQLN